MKKKKAKKNYINNKLLLEEVKKSKEQGKMTDKFAEAMMLLAKKYASQGSYSAYTYNDDMQGYALMTVCNSWDAFDADKYRNPFAYYTQTIKRAFWQFMAKEETHRDIRDEILIGHGELPSHSFSEKYQEKVYQEQYDDCIKKKKVTPAFRNLLRSHIKMLSGLDKSIRENIQEEILKDFFKYDTSEEKSIYLFFNSLIIQQCLDKDESYSHIVYEDDAEDE